MLNFAFVGLGGLGKAHLANYPEIKKIKDINLVALCDVEEEQFTKKIDINLGEGAEPMDLSAYNLYTDIDEMLEKEKLDFIIAAVPTYLHEEIAVKAMNKGIHVFSEKPMALSLNQCRSMIDSAKKNGVKLQIGQCCRFEAPRVNLKKLLDEGKYGKVVRAEFARFSPTPLWSWQNWYMDFEKSGGAGMDLHIHDVDCVQWLFGTPKSVFAVAGHSKSKFESVCSNFIYDDFYVTTMTDWNMASTYPFNLRGLVNCEKATMVIEPDGSLSVYPWEGEKYSIFADDSHNMYVKEVIEFISCIEENRESDIVTPESTMASIRMALAEQESAKKGVMVNL